MIVTKYELDNEAVTALIREFIKRKYKVEIVDIDYDITTYAGVRLNKVTVKCRPDKDDDQINAQIINGMVSGERKIDVGQL